MATPNPWLTHCTAAPRALRSWLSDRGSLTQRLQRQCPAFRVQLLRQGNGKPHPDEVTQLSLHSAQHGLLRDVLLFCNGSPVVFAHTALPRQTIRGAWRPLGSLGNRPLGQVLFGNPRIGRSAMQYRKIDRRHPLYRSIVRAVGPQPATLWARRSLFLLDNKPILVTEVFLANLP